MTEKISNELLRAYVAGEFVWGQILTLRSALENTKYLKRCLEENWKEPIKILILELNGKNLKRAEESYQDILRIQTENRFILESDSQEMNALFHELRQDYDQINFTITGEPIPSYMSEHDKHLYEEAIARSKRSLVA